MRKLLRILITRSVHHRLSANEDVSKITDGGYEVNIFCNCWNRARIGVKLWQNVFRMIPDASLTPESLFGEYFGPKIWFVADLSSILTSHGKTDLKISFFVKFSSR